MSIPAWHVDNVRRDDDEKLHAIMDVQERRTGERPTKSGTIRRAIRLLWQKEVASNEEN